MTGAASQAAPPLPPSAPEAQGFSRAGLERVHELMQRATGPGQYLGAVTLVARNGKIVHWRAYGHRDVGRSSPLERDAIFRVYSMTKTVNAVAVLMLLEEGRISSLDDRVGRHLPEFAASPVTIHHLLTHTSGLALATEVVEKSADLKAYSEAAARLPPAAAPGERFEYNSVNTEVASRLVEAASGLAFDAFLERRIFAPLRMRDTGFTVPREKRGRIADMTSHDREGRIVSWPAGDSKWPGDRMRPYSSGAGGLYSTAGDFARFCQMLLDGGRLDGVKILERATVEMMMTNQLTVASPYKEGFGYGGFVSLDDPARERPGSVGAFGWSGAAATYYTIDPRERLTMILLMQHIPQGLARDPQKVSFQFYNRVYESLSKPHPR